MQKSIERGILLAMALAGCLSISEVTAQKTYRCGSVYQDHPCESATQSKEVSVGVPARRTSAPPPTTGAAMYPECAQRGALTQKIVWAREAGETQEKMLDGERDPARKKLVTDVYRVRGTAAEVRSRIESECQVEVAEHAKVAALAEAISKANAARNPQAGSPNSAESDRPSSIAVQGPSATQPQSDPAAKKARCDDLGEKAKALRTSERSGGTTQMMDSLRRQRTELDEKIRKLAC
jgi:hypothetical protein